MSEKQILRVDSLTKEIKRQPTFLALGSFDGVHLGHQTVIGNMVEAATQSGVRSAVMTFFPHPKRVLQNLQDRYYINTLDDREALLAGLGVDLVITHRFDENLRMTSADDFIQQLCRILDMKQIWGRDFAFGYNREGNLSFLRRTGLEHGFSVQKVESMVLFDNRPVSSSRIRESLETGKIDDVNGCLGRSYTLRGHVAKGDQRGRTIGFPTANLDLWEELLLPANGVYATYAWIEGRRFAAATNVGVRPTVNGGDRVVEAHLLNFSDDLYGQTVKLEFVAYLRPEMKFSGLDSLKKQIAADVLEVEELL
ncbi:MAG: bifunctional riboflavin kinase/FAD synthetase [Candidatus Promineifilaceae bacterium]|nr:bifunctional riboflavin kinase/FAD synthetase [Candidatus Promineifilaceae bacterium]